MYLGVQADAEAPWRLWRSYNDRHDANMDYQRAWLSEMALVIGGRQKGDSDSEILKIPLMSVSAVAQHLLDAHRADPVGFEAAFGRLFGEMSAEQDAEEKRAGKAMRIRLKDVRTAYRKLTRQAFALPQTRRAVQRAGSRVQLSMPWMATAEGALPQCAAGHPMTLTVYVTAAELAAIPTPVPGTGNAVFCACVAENCAGEEGSWAMLRGTPNVARLVAAAG